MPLDIAARAVLSTDRSMLAAAFIFFLSLMAALRLSVRRRRHLALPGVTVGFGSLQWAHKQRSRAVGREI